MVGGWCTKCRTATTTKTLTIRERVVWFWLNTEKVNTPFLISFFLHVTFDVLNLCKHVLYAAKKPK